MKLTVFYDGNCPLCAAEMKLLAREDKHSNVCLKDINAPDFSTQYPTINVAEAHRILHGLKDNGEMLYGLDVTVTAWRLVGKKRWLSILRWPVISWFADKTYLLFAKHRQKISKFLMPGVSCDDENVCNRR